jgi:hypothetical protein
MSFFEIEALELAIIIFFGLFSKNSTLHVSKSDQGNKVKIFFAQNCCMDSLISFNLEASSVGMFVGMH